MNDAFWLGRARVYEIIPEVTIERTSKLMDDKETWCVRRLGTCLTRDLTWIHEPMPSNRTEEFLTATRFHSPEEALDFFVSYQYELLQCSKAP